MLAAGCTFREAWDAMMNQTGLIESYNRLDAVWFDSAVTYYYRDKMERAAEQGDAGAFMELHREARGFLMYLRAASLIKLRDEIVGDGDDQGEGDFPDQPEPPSCVIRPADDAAPDGEDDMTHWLEQQFRKAA